MAAGCTLTNRLAMTAAGLSAALVFAGSAEARITKISVGVSGTQSAHAHVADDGCSDQPGVVATGDMSESYSVRTYRRQTLVVLPGVRGRLAFSELQGQVPEILTRGSITRTSTLSADGRAMLGGCPGGTPASCGARSFARLALQAAPAISSRGSFQGVAINNAATQPRNPFTACSGPLGGPLLLFPNIAERPSSNGGRVPASFRAPIPASFLKSCQHGSMTRRLDGTAAANTPGTTAITGATTVHLRVTVANLGCLRGIA
jgi:hypothetical protein